MHRDGGVARMRSGNRFPASRIDIHAPLDWLQYCGCASSRLSPRPQPSRCDSWWTRWASLAHLDTSASPISPANRASRSCRHSWGSWLGRPFRYSVYTCISAASTSRSPSVGRLIFWAVVFRLCGLIGGPFYEDDFYRYLWDDYLFATAGTPYGVAPEDLFIDQTVPLALQAALNEINHPELPTIYGPTTEFVFLLGYWLQPGGIATLQSLLIRRGLGDLGSPAQVGPPAQRPPLRLVSTGDQGSGLHGPPRRTRRMPAAGCDRPWPKAALA